IDIQFLLQGLYRQNPKRLQGRDIKRVRQGVMLKQMARAAEAGKDSTRDLIARIGRASRLGERSRGHLDAGATSCWLILRALGDAIQRAMVE
ncbi:MAG: DAK2 domain-containing protein, partial [Anaerolineae bacterium]